MPQPEHLAPGVKSGAEPSLSTIRRLVPKKCSRMATAARRCEGQEGRALFRALRFYCLLEILYATGMRVSELVYQPERAGDLHR